MTVIRMCCITMKMLLMTGILAEIRTMYETQVAFVLHSLGVILCPINVCLCDVDFVSRRTYA
jgi:hypothetical protein